MQYSFIYPCETFNIKKVDKHFETEYSFFKKEGFNVALVDLDDNLIKGDFTEEQTFIYRGWMLSKSEYLKLEKLVNNKKCKLLTDIDSYYQSHYLFNQYNSNEFKKGTNGFTPETVFCEENTLVETLDRLNWDKFFVKDYVKSLTTDRGSIANNKNEVKEIVDLIKYYRGSIEGGISIRKVESFVEDTEVRYFVLNGKVYSPNRKFHDILSNINELHNEPFFSVDVIQDKQGKEWIVEIGDGQVSDLKGKGWSVEDFINIFK